MLLDLVPRRRGAAAKVHRRPLRGAVTCECLWGVCEGMCVHASPRPASAAAAAPFTPWPARAPQQPLTPSPTCSGAVARPRGPSHAPSAGTILAPAEMTSPRAASAFSGAGTCRRGWYPLEGEAEEADVAGSRRVIVDAERDRLCSVTQGRTLTWWGREHGTEGWEGGGAGRLTLKSDYMSRY